MTGSPVVIGVNRTRDGSIAVARGRTSVHSLQKERMTRREHHRGRLRDLPDHYLPRLPQLAGPVDLVVEGYSSDTEIANLAAYRAELRETLGLTGDTPVVLVSHHLSHLYSAFPPSPFEEAAGLVVDTQGSRVRDFTERVELPRGTPGDLLEVSSFYRCSRGRVECLAKQLWDGDWARPAGLGCFYALLTRMLWPSGGGDEGKVMDLAPFGDPDALGLPELDVRGHEVFIPRAWLDTFDQGAAFRYVTNGASTFKRSANLAAAGQRAFERALDRLAAWLHERTGLADLVFAGGTALNCTANGRLIRGSPFREVFIPPSPHDGGTAVGCALYGMIECLGAESGFRWADDFLGPEPDPAEIDAAVRALPEDLTAERPADLAGAIVELLAGGRTVGLHQGRSESGPRALGNRSILGDPRVPELRDYVNVEVKGREWFRPLAPLVLAEHAGRIFDVDRPAPFMQYAAEVRPEHREELPCVTHVDGTARPQTVEPGRTPFLHELLTRWHERTGCPVLVNASLNGPGDPLTETPEHSVGTLRKTGLHALALPPYLIRKRDEPPVPGDDWQPPARPV
ncbi:MULTISPECIES: carbamoyltransferase C-terminal domain-containing protein [Nonomuraea]|uniref:Carbamoyltransferase n=1 Tax=Nonomuraea ferruginea TaxID=46174 RepID=A0ABT4TAL4_9ACTN|nr:carbamoyltransferase C-terminal domain-containing protein [Nonomuraea ferruginea]MDA0646158.1 carbamoyltransferase [Nonomuraea ferruginea]